MSTQTSQRTKTFLIISHLRRDHMCTIRDAASPMVAALSC